MDVIKEDFRRSVGNTHTQAWADIHTAELSQHAVGVLFCLLEIQRQLCLCLIALCVCVFELESGNACLCV